jgi:FMN phosphatase YigB (HAD superfamily)
LARPSVPTAELRAVTVDLDSTLFPQSWWLAGAAAAGMRAVRVRTGEYAETPDSTGDPAPWGTAGTFAEAVDLILS